MLACTQGHYSVVELLVESGASVLATDEDGHSPLHLTLLRLHGPEASRGSHSSSAATSGGDKNAVSKDVLEQCERIAVYLAKSGADVTLNDSKDRNALSLVQDHIQLKEQLLKFKIEELPVDCLVCEDEEAVVIFKPCGHKIVCPECCVKMKKCLTCQAVIEKKVFKDGTDVLSVVNGIRQSNSQDEAQRELSRKLQEMEDTLTCNICLDRKRNVAFLCGHSACNDCAQPLRQCHMCRKPITKRINLFN